MRQALGSKKLRRYSAMLGVEFDRGMVRGNTEHRVDLWAGRRSYSYYPGVGFFRDGIYVTHDDPVGLLRELFADNYEALRALKIRQRWPDGIPSSADVSEETYRSIRFRRLLPHRPQRR